MDGFSRKDLQTLLERGATDGPCLSLFMPTHRTSADLPQDQLRLKNLLRSAEESLIATGMRAPEATRLLAPARELLTNIPFWLHRGDGLALFLTQDFFRAHHLPLELKEMVTVAGRFHIKPALALFTGDGRFFLLALALDSLRLLECTRHGYRELDLAGITPPNLDEALGYDHFDREQQFHHHSTTPSANQEPRFGHGEKVTRRSKDNILRYFQIVDRKLVDELLADEQAPLVLAGVDYLFPLYREANTYRNLLAEGVDGNPELTRAADLNTRAWAVVEPYFNQGYQQALMSFEKRVGAGLTSTDIKQVVDQASRGKVEIIFVARGLEQWGTFDPVSHTAVLHKIAAPGDEDLADLAVAYTIRHRGTVYAVEQARVPGGTAIAALLRR